MSYKLTKEESAQIEEERSLYWRSIAEKLERENAALRNEIARLSNQTNWVCKCGGTDCKGQTENAALLADKQLVDWIISGDGLEWIYWQREDGKERNVTRENMHAATKGWE